MSSFFKISEAGSIALHAMALLSANPDRHVRIREIAEAFEISEAHLAKVLNRLGKTGLVTATRGPTGGYTLVKKPSNITVLEIFEAIEGKVQTNRCMFSVPVCDGRGCALGRFFSEKSERIEDTLAKMNLSDITVMFSHWG